MPALNGVEVSDSSDGAPAGREVLKISVSAGDCLGPEVERDTAEDRVPEVGTQARVFFQQRGQGLLIVLVQSRGIGFECSCECPEQGSAISITGTRTIPKAGNPLNRTVREKSIDDPLSFFRDGAVAWHLQTM